MAGEEDHAMDAPVQTETQLAEARAVAASGDFGKDFPCGGVCLISYY